MKLGLFVFLVSSLSFAVDTFKLSGNMEGGWASHWSSPEKHSQFLLDNLDLTMKYLPSDKVKVVVTNSFALHPTTTLNPLSQRFETRRYYSRFQLNSGASQGASQFTFASNGAYLEHSCGDMMTTSIGNVPVPLGMESLFSRYDRSTYYWSTPYGVAASMGWNYDLGLLLTFEVLGRIEVAVLDGRATQSSWSPTTALRWSNTWEMGGLKLTPTVSGLLGAFASSPGDMAMTAGADLAWERFWFRTEFYYTKVDRAFGTDTSTKNWSLWFEPGVDVAFLKLSAFLDFNNQKVATADSINDMHLGAAITHEYNDKMRVRLAYQHQNMGEKLGPHENDIRLLWGTRW